MAHRGKDSHGKDAQYQPRGQSRGIPIQNRGGGGRSGGHHQPQPYDPRHIPAAEYVPAGHIPVSTAQYAAVAQYTTTAQVGYPTTSQALNQNSITPGFITDPNYVPASGTSTLARSYQDRDAHLLSSSPRHSHEVNVGATGPLTNFQQYPEMAGPFARPPPVTTTTIVPERRAAPMRQPTRYYEGSNTSARSESIDGDHEDRRTQTFNLGARGLETRRPDRRPRADAEELAPEGMQQYQQESTRSPMEDNVIPRPAISSAMRSRGRDQEAQEYDTGRRMGSESQTGSYFGQAFKRSNETTSRLQTSAISSAKPVSYAGSPPTSRDFAPQTQFEHLLPVNLREFAKIRRTELRNVANYARQDPAVLGVDPQVLLNEAARAYAFREREYGDSLVQQYVIVKRLQQRLPEGKRRVPKDYFQKLLEKDSPTRKQHYQDFDAAFETAKSKAKAIIVNPPASATYSRAQAADVTKTAPDSKQQSHVDYRLPGNDATQDTRHFETSRYKDPQETSNFQYKNPASFAHGSFPVRAADPASDLGLSTNKFASIHDSSTPATISRSVPTSEDMQISTSRTPGTNLQQQPARVQVPYAVTPRVTGPIPSSEVKGADTKLDSRFIVRDSSFYCVGRVFSVLWHDNMSSTARLPENARYTYTSTDTPVSTGRFGEQIYTTVRRMVVVRASKGFCVCIQINTYAGRGLAKYRRANQREDVQAHSIIYMDNTTPEWLPDEPRSSKRAIAVRKAQPEQNLDSASRLCYNRPHTVEHTVKSMDVGFVRKESIQDVLQYYAAINKIT